METFTIFYNTKSPKGEIRHNRFQLLAATLSIVIGYVESFAFYKGISVIIPVIGFIIAIFNIPLAVFYEKFTNKYGNKFEIMLLRTDGLIMLITGIGYQLAGSDLVPIAYYILTLMYFVVLPYFLLPAKAKRYYVQISVAEISLRGMLRRIQIRWNDIEFISIGNNLLKLKRLGRRKVYKCFIRENETGLPEALKIIDEKHKEFVFTFKRDNDFNPVQT